MTIWYTAPSTIRRLMEAGNDLVRRYDLSHLDHIATVGETLLPERFFWVKEHLKKIPHDTYWMTETGMICLANFPSMAVKPGSMGKPVPGVEAAVLERHQGISRTVPSAETISAILSDGMVPASRGSFVSGSKKRFGSRDRT